MSPELIEAAYELHRAAKKYREIYSIENKKDPVIWVTNNETGDCVVITDSFNREIIKAAIL